MTVLTIAQTRAAEQAAVEHGSSFAELMEHAGGAAARALLRDAPNAKRIVILCGKGNNGGDGLVMARHLANAGKQVTVMPLGGDFATDLARKNFAALPADVACCTTTASQLNDFDVVVDAVYGIGFDGALPPDIAQIFDACRDSGSFNIALDIASGIHADSGNIAAHAFRADATYVFHSLKPAHLLPAVQAHCGACTVLDIGITV